MARTGFNRKSKPSISKRLQFVINPNRKELTMKYIATYINAVDAVVEYEVINASSHEEAIRIATANAGAYFAVTSVKEATK